MSDDCQSTIHRCHRSYLFISSYSNRLPSLGSCYCDSNVLPINLNLMVNYTVYVEKATRIFVYSDNIMFLYLTRAVI